MPSSLETGPPTVPKAKLTAMSRFKQFAEDHLGIKPQPKIVFPPPSWQINDVSNPYLGENAQDNSAITAESPEDVPEPKTFALKIRQMIESLPPSVTAAIGMGPTEQGTSHASQESTSTSIAPPIDGRGPPIPENVDAKTMRLLSSKNVMNGDDSDVLAPRDGAHRQSVWSALEGMEPGHTPESREQIFGPPPTHPDLASRRTEHAEQAVMMYSPLEPTADSEVEIAESKEVNTTSVDQGTPAAPPATMTTRWVPSTTKISVLTTWWGYRLYLPPPVMAILDSSQIKATQRAAMITTALTWFLKKVPTMMVPAPMMPAVKVLRRLSPLLSYIGVFIAWSWSRITACDRGNGVVLSATWLLPVALIPMAWDAGDIYGPPIRPPPATTPPDPQMDHAPSGFQNRKGKEKSKRWVPVIMF
ncbi:hypothetical protein C0995_015131 [Termitomyces sp. Mi166|nr:hypothetical protein C0995_015131 [Termitomyces sp. Mi166\